VLFMVETEQTLAERGLEKRNSASQLLEGETFLKGYTYRNTVVFTFPDGSIRVRSSDGPLGLVTPLRLCEPPLRVCFAWFPSLKLVKVSGTSAAPVDPTTGVYE